MTDHDAELIVRNFDRIPGNRGPSGWGIVWRRTDGQPLLSKDEHDGYQELVDEAEERYDEIHVDHKTVIAHIWLDGRSIDRVEWTLDED